MKTSNLSKPDSKNWKKVSNFFLYTMPVYLTAIMTLPISETYKLWINFGITILTVTLKGFSKFTTDEDTI